MNRALAGCKAAALAIAMAAAGSAGAAGDPSHDHATHETAPVGMYSQTDLKFLAHMIVHHQQALELCELVPARSTRADLLRFSRYLKDAQQNEIHQMRELLRLAADRGARIPDQLPPGDPPMAGMLTRAQLQEIAASTGSGFEQLWLEGMILHHQGGVAMAREQQEAQFRNSNQPWGVDVLVDEMLTVQRGEIRQMQEWLQRWR